MASAVDARFQPEEPDLKLLSLSTEVPYQAVALVRHRWRRPPGYLVGFGMVPVYDTLCEGPCDLRLMRGQYHWALSKAGGPVVAAVGTTVVSEPSTLHAHYEDNSGIRTAGAIVGITGMLAGIVMMFESFHDKEVCDGFGNCYTHADVNGGLLAGGLGVFIGSAIASSLMLSRDNEARITITPLKLHTAGLFLDSGYNSSKVLTNSSGAAVTVRF